MIERLARDLAGILSPVELQRVAQVHDALMGVLRALPKLSMDYRASAENDRDPEPVLRIVATNYVSLSFASVSGLPGLAEALAPQGAGAERFPTEIARLMQLPQGRGPDVVAQHITANHDMIVRRLNALIETLVQRGLAEHRALMEAQDVADEMDVHGLIDGGHLAGAAAVVPFVRADLVRITESGPAKPESSSTAIPAPAPAPATPAGADHRVRADALQETVNGLRERLATLDRRAQDEESAAAQLRDINKALRAQLRRVESFRDTMAATTPVAAAAPTPIPDQWDGLESFVQTHLGGNVVLTRKAARAARASSFEDIPLAYRVLLMLAEDYVPMRRGVEGARARFDRTCRSLRVEVGPTGQAAEHHLTKAAYRVEHLGVRLPLDLHVRGSSARDPRIGFRCYFAWFAEPDDPHGGYVVVGSLPTHLDSTHS